MGIESPDELRVVHEHPKEWFREANKNEEPLAWLVETEREAERIVAVQKSLQCLLDLLSAFLCSLFFCNDKKFSLIISH